MKNWKFMMIYKKKDHLCRTSYLTLPYAALSKIKWYFLKTAKQTILATLWKDKYK